MIIVWVRKTNPVVLVRVIRALHNLTEGTGYGKIVIYMKEGKITVIENIESDKLEESTMIDKVE